MPLLSLWGLPDPGIEFRSPALQADSLAFEPPVKPLLIKLRAKSKVPLTPFQMYKDNEILIPMTNNP